MKRFIKAGIAALPFLPALALAQSIGTLTTDTTNYVVVLLANILVIINSYIIPLIFAVAIIYFFVGLVKFIAGDSADLKEAAKGQMLGGIIALFVMFSVFGLIRILQNSFGLSNSASIPTPKISY